MRKYVNNHHDVIVLTHPLSISDMWFAEARLVYLYVMIGSLTLASDKHQLIQGPRACQDLVCIPRHS